MVLLVAYADDTTIYLQRMSCLPAVQRGLLHFARTSGLMINVAKSTVVPLVMDVSPELHVDAFAVLHPGETARYLGLQVGRGLEADATWGQVLNALRVRLVLAERKLTTVDQRIQFARGIIIPKLLYVARHVFPSAERRKELQTFIHVYIWAGKCAGGATARAWVADSIAHLGHRDGGLAEPSLTIELQLLGVRALLRWNGLLLPAARLATTVLLQGAGRPRTRARDACCDLQRMARHRGLARRCGTRGPRRSQPLRLATGPGTACQESRRNGDSSLNVDYRGIVTVQSYPPAMHV